MTRRNLLIKGVFYCTLFSLLFSSGVGYDNTAHTAADEDSYAIDWFSFLGGTGDEGGKTGNLMYLQDVVVCSNGDFVVASRSASTDFPVKNAIQETCGGGIDVTITKYTSAGEMLFSTYYGGNGNDWATGVELDSEENIIVTGTTRSSDFPLVNAYQSTLGGPSDAFVLKLSLDGQTVYFATYLGGNSNDWSYVLAIAPDDRIAFAGTVYSTDFPLLDPCQDTHMGGLEGYVSVFNPDGQSLNYSTYFGGTSDDSCRGLAFNNQGELFMTGGVKSRNLAFGTYFKNQTDGIDSFLAKYNRTGSLQFMTYLGGASSDRGDDLKLDSHGDVWITGYTYSSNYPIVNGIQTERIGPEMAIATKIAANGSEILYSTFIGGTGANWGYALTLDADDTVYIVGETSSEDFPGNYPLAGYGGGNRDAFLVRFNENASEFAFSSLLGGNDTDVACSIGLLQEEGTITVLMAGYTESGDMNQMSEYNGASDTFIMKLLPSDWIPITTATTTETADTNSDDSNSTSDPTSNNIPGFTLIWVPIFVGLGWIFKKSKKGSSALPVKDFT
jgi:hypothetical protein